MRNDPDTWRHHASSLAWGLHETEHVPEYGRISLLSALAAAAHNSYLSGCIFRRVDPLHTVNIGKFD